MNLSLRGSGFGLCLLDTINQIRYCQRESLIPLAVYDADAESHFFDPELGNSMWEQLFEPLGEFSVKDLRRHVDDPQHPLHSGNQLRVQGPEMVKLFEQNKDSIFAWPFGVWRRDDIPDMGAWFEDQRARAREPVRAFIRPRREILDKVDWRPVFVDTLLESATP